MSHTLCVLQITCNEAAQIVHARALKQQESYSNLSEDNKRLALRTEALTGQVRHGHD